MPLVELILPEAPVPSADPALPEAMADWLCCMAIAAMGGDPTEPAAQEITRCEIRRPRVISAGRARRDMVRVAYTLPAGSLSRVRKARLARETTEGVMRRLGTSGDSAAHRVWVTIHETPDFAAAGRFWTRREIAEWVLSRRPRLAETA